MMFMGYPSNVCKVNYDLHLGTRRISAKLIMMFIGYSSHICKVNGDIQEPRVTFLQCSVDR